MEYDPNLEIKPELWKADDEAVWIGRVEQYHHRKQVRLPDAKVHALIHVAVENQLAMGDEFPAKAVLARLMKEGLDRREAIHAVGSVLAGCMFNALREQPSPVDLNESYRDELQRLTADAWRNMEE